ncbi:MAG: RNA chaperone Hfq [Fimbriimonadales bacterium]|nr:RNA chaperone Hfq [Fimbriimonadales bacterium]
MAKAINLQEMFLNQVRKEGISVTVFLTGGVQIKGMVRGFDAFTILLDSPGKPTQLVYKHAVSAVLPSRPIPGYRPPNARDFDDEGGDDRSDD